MKKHIFITLLILTLSYNPAISKELFESPADLENFYDHFYEAPVAPVPTVEVVDGSIIHGSRRMPLFKKTRIKVTNYFRERDYNKTLKLIEKQKQILEEIENKNENKEVKVNFVDPVKDISEEIDKTLELEGGVKEHVTANDVMLDADNIDYDDKTFDITATGRPVLVFPPQKVTIKADKMIYNTASNILKAFGSVEVIRNGSSIFGDYMQINMNEENAFLDNVNAKQTNLTVSAQKAEMEDDKLVLYNGSFESTGSNKLNFHTRMIGGNMFHTMLIDDEDRSSITDEFGDTAIKVKAKDVYINAKKDHDTITLKKAKIRYGDYPLFTFPSITAHTNKTHQYFEANYPEFGSRSRIGMFAGPGFTFDTPLQNGSTVKLIPFINNKDGLGFGGFLKYRSGTNFTMLGYGSSADVFVLKGKQMIDDKLYLQYGSNSYMDEWFFGPRMSKYNAELIYHDNGVIHSTIGNGLDLSFRHRVGFGYMQNSEYNRHGEYIPTTNMGTTRTRYMAEAAQTLYKFKSKNSDLRNVSLALVMQGSAALYGTGDTQFIGRIGPRIHSQYKYWMQDIGYFVSTFDDHTPMQTYDMYRYGQSSVYLRESLRVNKYLTLAWSGTLTLSDDAPSDKMFQENSFIVALGPDDFKFNIGYDWVRRQTYFSFIIAMDAKGSSLSFDRMEIKNPDRLAKSDEPEVELKVFEIDDGTKKVAPKKMIYAEVIDLEDPDKEQI